MNNSAGEDKSKHFLVDEWAYGSWFSWQIAKINLRNNRNSGSKHGDDNNDRGDAANADDGNNHNASCIGLLLRLDDNWLISRWWWG